MTVYHFIFIVVAFFSVYIQTKSYALEDHPAHKQEYMDLLGIRRVTSPLIAGLAAVLVAVGAFVVGSPPRFLGVLFTAVWTSASLGDIFIEGSYSSQDDALKARYYITGMALFILFTLGLGIGLVYYALLNGASGLNFGMAVLVSVVMGILAYRTLKISAETRLIMLVYTFSVTALLCGGILSAVSGSLHLAFIGIAYFFSDWFVGLRDFGKKVPGFLRQHILIVILILYYTIMLASIDLMFSG